MVGASGSFLSTDQHGFGHRRPMPTAVPVPVAAPVAVSPPPRVDPRLPVVLALVNGIDDLVRRSEAGEFSVGELTPVLLGLVADAVEGFGAPAAAVDALRRFSDIDRAQPAAAAEPAPVMVPVAVGARDPILIVAEAAAEVTYLIMTGMGAEPAAQKVARRFVLTGQEDIIPSCGDDRRAYKRLLYWRMQLLGGRFGEPAHAGYHAALAAFKARAGLPERA